MVEIFLQRRQLIRAGQCRLLPLNKIVFAGSAAYVVNAESKEKLLNIFGSNGRLDVPYDLAIRQLVYAKQVNGFVALPFPTSLSEYAESSSIQKSGEGKIADVAWNAFRRLVWLGGSTDQASVSLDRIPEVYFDSESQVFSKILECMLSPNFVNK